MIWNTDVSAYVMAIAGTKTPTALSVPNPRDIFAAFMNNTKDHAIKEAAKAL